MTNATRTLFKQLFEEDLRLLRNPVCIQCDAQVRHPLLPWLVGRRFFDSDDRILFVGKPHRGKPGELLQSGIIDPTRLVAENLWHKHWPYWSYTREIAENLYGKDGRDAFDFIAMTNFIKCTNVDGGHGNKSSTDRTSYRMGESCVLKLGVIWKEIAVLKPNTVIFYTFGLYRTLLEIIPIASNGTVAEIHSQNHAVQCRNKRLGWWERSCRTSWTDNFRILVVGHPERMARHEYVYLLTSWLRPTHNHAMND